MTRAFHETLSLRTQFALQVEPLLLGLIIVLYFKLTEAKTLAKFGVVSFMQIKFISPIKLNFRKSRTVLRSVTISSPVNMKYEFGFLLVFKVRGEINLFITLSLQSTSKSSVGISSVKELNQASFN